MDEFICPRTVPPETVSPENIRRPGHGHSAPGGASLPRFPFWDLGKRLNPRYLPILENTCPQPTSVKERLSPRLYSPRSKNKEKQTEMIPITHPLAMRTNGRTDGRMDSQCLVVLHRPRFPVGSLFLSIPTGNHTFLLSFPKM